MSMAATRDHQRRTKCCKYWNGLVCRHRISLRRRAPESHRIHAAQKVRRTPDACESKKGGRGRAAARVQKAGLHAIHHGARSWFEGTSSPSCPYRAVAAASKIRVEGMLKRTMCST